MDRAGMHARRSAAGSIPRAQADTQIISEIVLFIEKRKGMPRAFRYINEFLLAFCSIFLLAAAIAASIIVMTKKATVSAPGVPQSTVDMLLKATGKTTAYKDTFAYYASECLSSVYQHARHRKSGVGQVTRGENTHPSCSNSGARNSVSWTWPRHDSKSLWSPSGIPMSSCSLIPVVVSLSMSADTQ